MTFTEITKCCDQIRRRFTFDWLDGIDSEHTTNWASSREWDWPPRTWS